MITWSGFNWAQSYPVTPLNLLRKGSRQLWLHEVFTMNVWQHWGSISMIIDRSCLCQMLKSSCINWSYFLLNILYIADAFNSYRLQLMYIFGLIVQSIKCQKLLKNSWHSHLSPMWCIQIACFRPKSLNIFCFYYRRLRKQANIHI